MTETCWRGECRTGCYYADACSLTTCSHEWLDRPESDTHECLICGDEAAGPASVGMSLRPEGGSDG